MDKIVALDCDGVTFNWYLRYCLLTGTPYRKVPEYGIKGINWSKILKEEAYWSDLPGLGVGVSQALHVPIHCYITAGPERFAEERRQNLLDLGFPDAPIHFMSSQHKADFCEVEGIDIFVDDKPSTVESFADKNTLCLQFMPAYAGWKPYMFSSAITCLSEINDFL